MRKSTLSAHPRNSPPSSFIIGSSRALARSNSNSDNNSNSNSMNNRTSNSHGNSSTTTTTTTTTTTPPSPSSIHTTPRSSRTTSAYIDIPPYPPGSNNDNNNSNNNDTNTSDSNGSIPSPITLNNSYTTTETDDLNMMANLLSQEDESTFDEMDANNLDEILFGIEQEIIDWKEVLDEPQSSPITTNNNSNRSSSRSNRSSYRYSTSRSNSSRRFSQLSTLSQQSEEGEEQQSDDQDEWTRRRQRRRMFGGTELFDSPFLADDLEPLPFLPEMAGQHSNNNNYLSTASNASSNSSTTTSSLPTEEEVKQLSEPSNTPPPSLESRIVELNHLKQQALELEDFDAAQIYKEMIEEIRTKLHADRNKNSRKEGSKMDPIPLQFQLKEFQKLKQKAVEEEDFKAAKHWKLQIDKLEKLLAGFV